MEIVINDCIYLVAENFQENKSLVEILIDIIVNFERTEK